MWRVQGDTRVAFAAEEVGTVTGQAAGALDLAGNAVSTDARPSETAALSCVAMEELSASVGWALWTLIGVLGP